MYHPFKFPLMFASWLSPWLAFALLVAAPATQAGEPALQRIRMARHDAIATPLAW